MKSFFTFFVVFFTFSGLFAQSECTVKIVYTTNKSIPPSNTFKTEPQTVGAKYYWSFGDNSISDSPTPTHTFTVAGIYLVQVKVTGTDGKVCYGELKAQFEGGTVVPPVVTITGKGKVKKTTSTDGCGLLITMENGSVLVPMVMVTPFEFKDGQYLELAYELLKDKPSGCSAGVSAKITKIADITPPSVCNLAVTFTKNSTTPVSYTFKTVAQAEGSRYYWMFGDSTISDSPSPVHTYKVANSYLVFLKVVDKAGKVCYGELKAQFEGGMIIPPVVTITGKGKVKKTTSTDGCGLLITMENGSVLVPMVMVTPFEFKDGQYLELAYELLKDKPSGCSAGVSAKITKIADITPPSVCNLAVTFTKNSTTPVSYTFKTVAQAEGSKYYWMFGDSTVSDSPSPIHTYKVANSYLVNLKVIDKAGKVCYGELKAQFEGGTAPQPVVKFTGKGKVTSHASATGCGLVITVENGMFFVPAKIVTDFQLKEGQYVEFTYEKLAEKVSTCKEGVDIKIISIKEIVTNLVCKANFTATNKLWSDPAMMKKMVFTNLSTGDIKECKWNFGDNTTSTELKPTHEYAAFGEYKVCLIITTVAGCVSDYCAAVKVENILANVGCKFDLVIKPKEAVPNTFLFSVVCPVEIKTIKWSFGDGKFSDGKNPEHLYEKTGVYEVSCTITTATGCTETRTVKHNVVAGASLPNCKGAINLTLYDPTENKCNGSATVKLLDEAGKEIKDVLYYWSDGRTGTTGESLCSDKQYTVQVISQNTCQKNTSFVLLSKPVWRTSAINGQNNFTVIEPIDGVKYEWNFGNGIVLTGADVNFTFANDGVYDVTLKAVSESAFSEYSQPVVVSKSITAIDILSKSELEIYPNPVKELLRIDFNNPVDGNIVIDIRNVAGRSVYNQQLSNDGSSHADINIQQLQSGIYLIRITNGQHLIADRKFIKAD